MEFILHDALFLNSKGVPIFPCLGFPVLSFSEQYVPESDLRLLVLPFYALQFYVPHELLLLFKPWGAQSPSSNQVSFVFQATLVQDAYFVEVTYHGWSPLSSKFYVLCVLSSLEILMNIASSLQSSNLWDCSHFSDFALNVVSIWFFFSHSHHKWPAYLFIAQRLTVWHLSCTLSLL